MKPLTVKQLQKETCRSFGGNNCVLHQCMFGCVLQKEIKQAYEREIKEKPKKQ